MARRRRTTLLEDFVRLIVIFFVLCSSSFLAFWKNLTSQHQTLFLILITALFITSAALIIVWIRYRKRQRELAWMKAMAAWDQSRQEGRVINNQSARLLTPGHLEKFAAQLFKQMGYQVKHTGRTNDHGIDVHLINPKGEVELVQCKQWKDPVGEPAVRDLAGAMVHEKAVRGFIIAPGGFTQKAWRWAKGKPIILADEREIERLVESAF